MQIHQTLSVVGFMVAVVVRATLANTTAATETNGETDGCPAILIWTPNKQSCYQYLEEKVNFTQANGSCGSLGANLVSISSAEENQFVRDFVGAIKLPVWIGLFRTTTDFCAANACENWKWSDGSKLEYAQWAADIVESSTQCVFMDSQGEWDHGRHCSSQRGYVCERKRMFPSTIAEPTVTKIDLMNPSSSGIEEILVSITDTTRPNDCDDVIYDGDITPLIVGCVIGGLVIVCIIIASVFLVKRHRNASITDQHIRDKDRKSPKRDKSMTKKDRISSQKDEPQKDKDGNSTPKNHSKRCTNADMRIDDVSGDLNRGYSYEDVELGTRNKRGKQTPANSITGAHGGGGSNPEPVYAEPIKKKNRPGSEGVEVQENSPYASGK